MGVRQHVFNVLTQDPSLSAIFANRVSSGESLMTAQIAKPYIVYRMGNDTDEGMFDDPDVPSRPNRQFFMVYIHDERPDYTGIDTYCQLVKNAFRLNPKSPSDNVVWTTFLEQSADFDDVTLDTVFRYLRFQAVMV